MDRYDRIFALHKRLQAARYPVSGPHLEEELGCSRATLYRDIGFLRDVLQAPLLSTDAGFFYDRLHSEQFELPGLWFSSDELHALLATHELLNRSGADVLTGAMAPLKKRIDALLANQSQGKRWPIERIRVIGSYTRQRDEVVFRQVAGAVLERKRLRFDYTARSTNKLTTRTVSPQRLTHYRDNWYLDAYDHERDALRSFSVERIRQVKVLDEPARDIAEQELSAQLSDSYGIFSGPARHVATIVFSAEAARWVSEEHWHSKQEGRFLDDGRYELKVPYSNPRELLMDVLRYGADAEITAPVPLRESARMSLQLALSNYGD
jgi:predicted DNA-binding transcriptional regulator YafY